MVWMRACIIDDAGHGMKGWGGVFVCLLGFSSAAREGGFWKTGLNCGRLLF